MTSVAVLGATGHTGTFVVDELRARGFTPVPCGRDALTLGTTFPDLNTRTASIADPSSLDRALAGAAAVINCAGPFATTAAPLARAARRAGLSYVDVAAEIESVGDTFRDFADDGPVVLPAMAFFGGLGDLLVTAAMAEWTDADRAHIAYGLSGWQPTRGTLAAGEISHQRRGGRRVRFTHGRLNYHDTALHTVTWPFPAPWGPSAVISEFTMADVVTVPSHLNIPEVTTYMAVAAAEDLAAARPGPQRRAETFTVDVIVRRGRSERRMTASGRDIYAVTAPLAVEAVERILTGRTRTRSGVASAGALFDAPDFLRALSARLKLRSSR